MKHHDSTAADSACRTVTSLCVAFVMTVIVLLAASAVPAQDEAPEDYGMIKVGKGLYKAYCTTCHGPAAEGDGPLAESLRVTPANLTLLKQKSGGTFSFDRVMKKIDGTDKVKGHGSSDMPIWGEEFLKVDEDATEEQVHDKVLALTHYLRSLQVADPAS